MSAPAPPDLPVGPCSPWVDPSDIECAFGTPSPDPDDVASVALMASELLYELSGRQFAGHCTAIVRPCRAGCGCWGFGSSAGWAWGYGGIGDGFGWGWFNRAGTTCGCGCDERVKLAGYPVTAIVEVLIDGVVVDPADYQLTGHRYLQALTERAWPACQDMDSPADAPGTWSVEYEYGIAPPEAGRLAAAELACQFWLAQFNLEECLLPSGVTKVVRQGVTIERMLPMFGEGQRTGLILTDAFLATYNPAGLRRRPAVWSPDLFYPRKAT